MEEVAAVSGPLQKYRVIRGGVETVMKLNDADAARLGLGADDVLGPAALQGEHGPETVSFGEDETAAQQRKAAAQNKARQTAANKGSRTSRKAPPAPAPDDEQSQSGDEQQAAPHGGGDGGPGGAD